MSKPKLIYLHTGCKWSEPWDEAFLKQLWKRGVRCQAMNLEAHYPHEPGAFIGRLNESCRELKTVYARQMQPYQWCWPEVSAFQLYDDKCLQAQWLAQHGYPQPDFEVVDEGQDCSWDRWLAVMKKPWGSAGKHVRLIDGPEQLDRPCLLQEYCPGNVGDFRVTVIGDQVSTIGRWNRPGDFRASGSGELYLTDTEPELAELTWNICRQAGWATMGFDVLWHCGRWVITEMSYTWAIYGITDWTKTMQRMPMNRREARSEHPVKTLLDYLFARSETARTKDVLSDLP